MTTDLSILCATSHRRAAFWPWLAFNIGRQTVLEEMTCEIVVCGDDQFEDRAICDALEPLNAQLQVAKPRARSSVSARDEIAIKRNALQDAAKGEYIAWMDDDDLLMDRKWMSGALCLAKERNFDWVCSSGIVYLDIRGGEKLKFWEPRAWQTAPVPITTIARNDDLPRFTGGVNEDVRWLNELGTKPGIATMQMVLCALAHGDNTSSWLSSPRVQKAFRPTHVGGTDSASFFPEHGTTLADQLRALQKRLGYLK